MSERRHGPCVLIGQAERPVGAGGETCGDFGLGFTVRLAAGGRVAGVARPVGGQAGSDGAACGGGDLRLVAGRHAGTDEACAAATGLGGGRLCGGTVATTGCALALAGGAELGPAMQATASPPARLRTVSAATVTVSDDGRLVVIRSLSVGGGSGSGAARFAPHHTQPPRPPHSSGVCLVDPLGRT
jgi:hypothetical protein